MTAIDFHKLAKTELHCHLDGSLSLETIRHLADLAKIEIILRLLIIFVLCFKQRKP